MTFTRIALAAGAAGLLACGSALAKPGDEDAVRKTLADSFAKWIACDVEGAYKFDAPNRSGYYPDSKDLQVSTAEMRQQEADFCKNGGKNEATYVVQGVIMMGETAIAHGSGHYTRTEPDGAVSVDSDFTFTDILVRTKNGWRFRHSHVGAVLSPPGGDAESAATP